MKFGNSKNVAIDELVQIANRDLDVAIARQGITYTEADEIEADSSDIEPEQENDKIRPINFEQILARKVDRSKPITNKPYNLAAVDSGIVKLGELDGGGTCFAVRAAAVLIQPQSDGRLTVLKYNTGPLVINQHNRIPIFTHVGKRLGKQDLYIKYLEDGPIERDSAITTANQLQDRVRNFVERMAQEEAIGILNALGGGVLVIDGALPAATFDTPRIYIKSLLSNTKKSGIDVVALSKKTRITFQGRPLATLFNGEGYKTFTGYAAIKDLLIEEREEQKRQGNSMRAGEQITAADQLFVAKFSFTPDAISFRVDLTPRDGITPNEAMDNFFNGAEFYGGYPRALIEAHHQCVFLSNQSTSLRAELVARYGLRPQPIPNLNRLFQPYGAFGK